MNGSPTILGISHIDLSVSDLDRSEKFYTEMFSMSRVLDGRNDEHHFASRYVLHPASMLVIGLVQHEEPAGEFNERQTGLDHLSFSVADRDQLDRWAQRLDENGIPHSGIAEQEMWDVLVLRDPDNIQLEFMYMKPEAASLLTS